MDLCPDSDIISIMRKFKVVLLQILGPELWLRPHFSNIPLSLGYLKASCDQKRHLRNVDIEIIDLEKDNTPAPLRLADIIASKSPDIAGFSFYHYNSFKSLYVAGLLKRRLPGIRIIAGGPEITRETNYIINNPHIDILCFGEGEIIFPDILTAMLRGPEKLKNIKNIAYRCGKTMRFTESGNSAVKNPRSPYLSGALNLKKYKRAFLETQRGCIFKCSYCNYHDKNLSYFPYDRIESELKMMVNSGIREVFITDSSILPSSNFYKICRAIKKADPLRKMKYTACVYAEYLDKEKADLLKECNFTMIESGIQSIKDSTLRNVNRKPFEKKKFLNGIKLLKERGINCPSSIIIGLPGDSIKDIANEIDFLVKGRVPFVAHRLQLFPGSEIRKDADKHGIKYLAHPPYFIKKSSYISERQLQTAFKMVKMRDTGQINYNFIECAAPLENRKETKGCFIPDKINKVIMDPDSGSLTIKDIEKLSKNISGACYLPFTLWLKSKNINAKSGIIISLVSSLNKKNPFMPWNIILESRSAPSRRLISEIKKTILSKKRAISYGLQMIDGISVSVLTPQGKKMPPLKKDSDLRLVSTLRMGEKKYKSKLSAFMRSKKDRNILLDFDDSMPLEGIKKSIKYANDLCRRHKKNIFFRNLYLYFVGSVSVNRKTTSLPFINQDYPEYILKLDKSLKTSSYTEIDKNVLISIIKWKMENQSSAG